MRKIALITGITGQDGSYLAEFLLHKGYEVHGLIRRSSSFNTERINHIYVDPHIKGIRFFLHYGDLSTFEQISYIITNICPDEIYHLGAQSHVRVSFDMPEYTGDITALGTTRILEAIRISRKKIKFYQASSSEMFGTTRTPQNENTYFAPSSPYAISKLYAYWMTVDYRKSYGIFAANGILFNHETVASFMPMFCKKNNEEEFDIKPICEIVKFDETKKQYQSKIVSGMQVWGKTGWVDVTFASAYPHDIENDNKHPRFINSRTGAFMATAEHVVFMDNNLGKEVKNINLEDRVENIELPKSAGLSGYLTSKEEAELMGMMVGDGSITYSEKGTGVHGKFTNSSDEVRERFNSLWKKITGGHTVYYPNRSGFNPERIVGQLILAGGNDWLRKIDIYNNDRTKRIPKVILNSTPEIMLAFLRGYNITDGLKSNPCTYDFRNFKTNSPTLAMGLWYLIDKTTRQDINLTLEMKNDGRLFYSLNILSTVDNSLKEVEVRQLMFENLSQREISRRTQISRGFVRKIQHGGCSCAVHHFKEDPLGVKKIIDLPKYDGWFYDLETTSGEFHCGVGKCHVHNSPRRGETFVTRKVTRAIARIIAGEQDKLYLGNLSAKRDWGYAPEYVELMWKILQQNKPQDFVVGTGHSHSVEEFVKAAFKYAGLCYKKYVKIDKRYFRPTEVNNLIADGNKAKKCFGWQPKIKFLDLIKIMVDADMRMLGLRPVGESDKILKEKIPYKWWNMD